MALLFSTFIVARLITDTIISNFYAKPKARYFIKEKSVNSLDFSDIKDGLEIIKKERDQEDMDFAQGDLD